MKKQNIIKLAISIIICQLAGFIGSFFTVSSVSTWYLTLQKPSFNPPNWIFAPVWTTLFLLMGISLYLVWSSKKKDNVSLGIFAMQLLLNILWSVFFFGLRSPLLAFIEILVLLAVIILTTIRFYKISKAAAYLMLPYILWVSFAAVLNLFIAILN